MSLDLTLVFERLSSQQSILGYNRLEFPTGCIQALADAIEPLSTPLQEGLEWYGDDGLGRCTMDPWGTPLTYVTAHVLAPQLRAAASTPWSLAVAMFVETLPPATRVVLWWH